MTQSTETGSEARKKILKQGVVVSAKMDKTITVRMDRLVKHPLYGKYLKRKTNFKAHDEDNVAYEGDLVEIVFSRPLSKSKRWRLNRVVKQGPASMVAAKAAAETGTAGEGS